jgi:hypothetical protein
MCQSKRKLPHCSIKAHGHPFVFVFCHLARLWVPGTPYVKHKKHEFCAVLVHAKIAFVRACGPCEDDILLMGIRTWIFNC